MKDIIKDLEWSTRMTQIMDAVVMACIIIAVMILTSFGIIQVRKMKAAFQPSNHQTQENQK